MNMLNLTCVKLENIYTFPKSQSLTFVNVLPSLPLSSNRAKGNQHLAL